MLHRWHTFQALHTTMEGCTGASGGLAVASPSLLLFSPLGSAGQGDAISAGAGERRRRAGWAHAGPGARPAPRLLSGRSRTASSRVPWRNRSILDGLSRSTLLSEPSWVSRSWVLRRPGRAPCAAPGAGRAAPAAARPPELPGSEHGVCGTAQHCEGWGHTAQRKEAELRCQEPPGQAAALGLCHKPAVGQDWWTGSLQTSALHCGASRGLQPTRVGPDAGL